MRRKGELENFELMQLQVVRMSEAIGNLDQQLSHLEQMNSFQDMTGSSSNDFRTWIKTDPEPDSLEMDRNYDSAESQQDVDRSTFPVSDHHDGKQTMKTYLDETITVYEADPRHHLFYADCTPAILDREARTSSSERYTSSSLESLCTSGSMASSLSFRLMPSTEPPGPPQHAAADRQWGGGSKAGHCRGGLFDDGADEPCVDATASVYQMTIEQLRDRVLVLEQSCALARMPVELAEKEIYRLQATVVQLERVRDELTLQNFTLKSQLSDMRIRLSEIPGSLLPSSSSTSSSASTLTSNHDSGIDADSMSPVSSSTSSSSMHSRKSYSAFGGGGGGSSNGVAVNKSSVSILDRDVAAKAKRYATYKKDSVFSGEMKNMRLLIASCKRNEMELKKKLHELEEEKHEILLRHDALLGELDKEKGEFQRQSESMRREVEHEKAELRRRGDDLLNEMNSLKTRQQSAVADEDQKRLARILENQVEKFRRQLEDMKNILAAKEEECDGQRLDLETLREENERLRESLQASLAREKTLKIAQDQVNDKVKRLETNLEEERFLRMRYHNAVEDLKGKIRVFCRVKPLLASEVTKDARLRVIPKDILSLSIHEAGKEPRRFTFDRVYSPLDDQQTVFDDVESLVQSAVDGYNVCIWAYGQTGSGKTHTMIGDDGNPGIAPRAFDKIFEIVQGTSDKWDYSVSAVMLELYQDKLIDLFQPQQQGQGQPHPTNTGSLARLDIKKDRDGFVHVPGASVKAVSSAADLRRLFDNGAKARHKGTTNMNFESSRSHLILSILIESRSKISGTTLRGKLSLIDLAGSERASKTGATGCMLKEASYINKSLFALGDVISSLTAESSHIPYRNSKLTTLMQDSLGGNAKTLMIINVSSATYNLDETLSSLTYGARVKQVTNCASRVEIPLTR